MVSHDLLWRILWLYGHGQVVVAYRQDSVLAQGLAGDFAIIVGAKHVSVYNHDLLANALKQMLRPY